MLPPDYTFKFASDGTLIHKDAYSRLEKLLEAARNCDPDAHNMYVYNGAWLELSESSRFDVEFGKFLRLRYSGAGGRDVELNPHICREEKYLNAWRLLDCLYKFSDCYGDWQSESPWFDATLF